MVAAIAVVVAVAAAAVAIALRFHPLTDVCTDPDAPCQYVDTTKSPLKDLNAVWTALAPPPHCAQRLSPSATDCLSVM